MTRIAIIVGSTRPGRNGTAVAEWVHAYAKTRTDAEYESVIGTVRNVGYRFVTPAEESTRISS